MKKILFIFAIAISSLLPVMAQETVKTLYNGEPKEVTWESTLYIPAEEFSTDVNIGDYIYITFSNTSDVIEIKANGTWLPGSRYTTLAENTPDFKAYITTDMLKALKQYGLEICGAKFTVTGVSICNDGFKMPEKAIWGGYFWIDSWNTLEIFKTAFDNYNGQRYLDIYLSDDNGDYDGYFIKVLTKWNPETLWANNDQIVHTPRMATVDLKSVNVKESLADINTLMIQGNKEAGSPFNIIAVALRDEETSTGISKIVSNNAESNINIYNLQGVLVTSDFTIEEAKVNLPAGLYIANGKKFIIK